MQACLICGMKKFRCIHIGTRDVPGMKVLKCISCGCVQLESREYNTEENYANGGMLRGRGYNVLSDDHTDLDWNAWVKQTEADDERRFQQLSALCAGKNVLEFGCGSGGFLRKIKNLAASVTGIELMDEARKRLEEEGISVYKRLDDKQKYDVICMFHVIEHLNDPDSILKSLRQHMKAGGIFVCETCNADDALITKYHCRAFADFTYWSAHVFLYNSETLEKLMLRNGFLTVHNSQIQRYPLANHLYWLANGEPGGHVKWKDFCDQALDEQYARMLADRKVSDTLWYMGMAEK